MTPTARTLLIIRTASPHLIGDHLVASAAVVRAALARHG